MSVPSGNFGIAIFSYDKLANVYDKPCASNVAPLERVGISVSMDRASYNSAVAGVYGYPGDWDSNFVKILTYIDDVDLTTSDADTIATNATVVPSTQIVDDGSTVTVQVIKMVPEDWAGTTQTIHFIFQFSHNKSGTIETDYVVIPVRLTVRDFEDGTGAGLIQLISVEDNLSNDVSKGVCFDSLPETITFTFQYNGASPENYLFIPLIRSEFSDWQEHDPYTNANMAQLESDFVISADEDFTGGTAELVLDGSKFSLGDYCVAAIAKMAAPAAPVACSTTIDVTLDVACRYWTEESFTFQMEYEATPLAGYTVERIQVSASLIRTSAGPPKIFGTLLQIVDDDVESVSGSAAVFDNALGDRPVGGTYTFKVEALVRVIDDATGAVCSFNGYWYEFDIYTPNEGETLINYIDSYSHNEPALEVTDKGKIN